VLLQKAPIPGTFFRRMPTQYALWIRQCDMQGSSLGMLRSRRSPGRVRRAGVVLTCGKDNLLKLVDPRTFQAGRPPRP